MGRCKMKMKEKVLRGAFRVFGGSARSDTRIASGLLLMGAVAFGLLGFAEASTPDLEKFRFGIRIAAGVLSSCFVITFIVSWIFFATSKFDLAGIRHKYELAESKRILKPLR